MFQEKQILVEKFQLPKFRSFQNFFDNLSKQLLCVLKCCPDELLHFVPNFEGEFSNVVKNPKNSCSTKAVRFTTNLTKRPLQRFAGRKVEVWTIYGTSKTW